MTTCGMCGSFTTNTKCPNCGAVTDIGRIKIPDYMPKPTKINKTRKASSMTTALPGVPDFLATDDDDRFATEPLLDSEAAVREPVAPKTVNKKVKVPARKRKTHPNKLATVPHDSVWTNYIGRNVYGMDDDAIFSMAFEEAMNVLVKGPTGSGKTMGSQAFAAKHDKPFYSFGSNGAAEPMHLFGKLLPTGNGNELAWFDGPVTDIVRYGGVLLINEINFMPRSIATAMFGLLDSRRALQLVDHKGEVIEAHRPGCWCDLPESECRDRWILIVADMNPGYAGTMELNEALLNRFAIHLDWGYDRDVEQSLVLSPALIEFAWKVRTGDGAHGMRQPISTNMLMEFESTVNSLRSLDFAWGVMLSKIDERDRTYVTTQWNVYAGNIQQDYVNERML